MAQRQDQDTRTTLCGGAQTQTDAKNAPQTGLIASKSISLVIHSDFSAGVGQVVISLNVNTIVATLHDFVLCTFTALPFSPTRAQKHTSTSSNTQTRIEFDAHFLLCHLQYQTNTEYTEADTLIVVFLSII